MMKDNRSKPYLMKSYMMKSYRLHRVGLFSTFRFGLILGFILNFLPVLVVTILLFWGANLLADWMAGLRSALPLPGNLEVPVNTIDLLGLRGFFQTLEALARMAAWQVALLGVVFWMGMAFLTGLVAWITAVVFNVISAAAGGIEMVLDETTLEEDPSLAETDPGRQISTR